MDTAERPQTTLKRKFLPAGLVIRGWDSIEPYFQELAETELDSVAALEAWLRKVSETESAFFEEFAWRYIRMTCNTSDPDLRNQYNDFVENSMTRFRTEENKLRKRLNASPYLSKLDPEKYGIMIRSVRNSIELFREENIPLLGKVQTLSQKYGETTGVMEVEHNGEKFTLPRAGAFLESHDRTLRESIWRKISSRRLEDEAKLDTLYNELIGLRQEISRNAGFDNFVGYCFRDLGRFDYSPQDCSAFHEAVEKEIRPVYERFMLERKAKLGLDVLRPWDLAVDLFGDQPLRPFRSAHELIEGAIRIFDRLDADFGSLLRKLRADGLLDLESRVGKAPGGYNYPLPETGLSFIFMNAVGTIGDLITMVHEVGHAVHAQSMQELELNEFRNTPSELAELASMSMELLTMGYWDEFFPDKEELRRARYEEVSRAITLLPWIATVDAFQRWVYENHGHTPDQRRETWIRLFRRFHGEVVDWSGLEKELGVLWQKQIHIFEVPFYYIEYGIAQLGAIAVRRNFKKDPASALKNYKQALSLGYTRTIPRVYEAAGIRFDFSHSNISDLTAFLLAELEALKS